MRSFVVFTTQHRQLVAKKLQIGRLMECVQYKEKENSVITKEPTGVEDTKQKMLVLDRQDIAYLDSKLSTPYVENKQGGMRAAKLACSQDYILSRVF